MDVGAAGAIVAMGRKKERGFLLETGWLGRNGGRGVREIKWRKVGI